MTGPVAYQNWRAALAEEPGAVWVEVPMYSDVRIIGNLDVGCGPYQIMTGFPDEQDLGRSAQSALFLRWTNHVLPEMGAPDLDALNADHFHGGRVEDEIAALLSLLLGCRLRAGGFIRMFCPGDDPLGRPSTERSGHRPTLVAAQGKRPVLPRIQRQCSLVPHEGPTYPNRTAVQLFQSYPSLDPDDATALARAARLYQTGVWVAEADPQVTWLLLVSAVETLACRELPVEGEPSQVLQDLMPDLYVELAPFGDQAVGIVAAKIVHTLKATKKFRDFVKNHFPAPPDPRAPLAFQLKWNKTTILSKVNDIYGYRSDALHAGSPFPAPLCAPPMAHGADGASEKFEGLGAQAHGGGWAADALPMYLDTFRHIARESILRWFESRLQNTTQGEPAAGT